MIPIKIEYGEKLINEFRLRNEKLSKLILSVSNSRWRMQKDITFTQEFRSYFESINDIKEEIISAFSYKCIYCLNKASQVSIVHPIEHNFNYPELCQDLRNVYALCSNCKDKFYVKYSNSLPDKYIITNIEQLMVKAPDIILPTFEPSHLFFNSFLNPDKGQELFKIRMDRALDYQLEENEKNKFYKLYDTGRFEKTLNRFNLKYINDIKDILLEARLEGYLSTKEIFYSIWFTKFTPEERIVEVDYNFANQMTPPFSKKSNNYIFRVLNTGSELRSTYKIRSITWENLRSFNNNSIEIKETNVLCLIGENGIGKSTFLTTLSLFGTADKRTAWNKFSDILSYDTSKKTTIHIETNKYYEEYDTQFRATVTLGGKSNIFPQSHEKIPVCYIGEHRINKAFLSEFKKLLLSNDNTFNEVAKVFNEILNLNIDEGLTHTSDEIFINRSNSKKVKLFESSSGARSIFYIIYSIISAFPKYKRGAYQPNTFYGYVLIDEIELHLHPKWKIGIVSKLKKIYPDLFFVVSTHDPLVLQGLNSKEIILLERDVKNDVTIMQRDLPDIESYTIDLILTSPYFSLNDTHNYLEKTETSSKLQTFETYREKLISRIYDLSLELNLKFNEEELSILVAQNFSMVNSLEE